LSGEDLGLHGELLGEWNQYIQALQMAHIRLVLREDKIIWDLHPSRIYTPKAGYITLDVELLPGEEVWWW